MVENYQNRVPLTDMFALCCRMADMIAPGGLKIAFIDRASGYQA